MTGNVQVRYTGTAPGADTNVYPLFSTITALFPARGLSTCGVKRLVLSIKNSQAGTLKLYMCQDGVGSNTTARGTNWNQIAQFSVAAAAATDVNVYDLMVAEYADIKVDWLNGGVAQATWFIDIVLDGERARAS